VAVVCTDDTDTTALSDVAFPPDPNVRPLFSGADGDFKEEPSTFGSFGPTAS
jgi:hypothetical protein